MKASHKHWGFRVVMLVVNLHLLRNSIPLPYGALYAAVLTWLSVSAAWKFSRFSATAGPGVLPWLAIFTFGAAVTLVVSGPFAAAYGLARLLFALPMLLALYLFTDDERDLRTHAESIAIFGATASVILIWQTFAGPIAWFVEQGERAGFARYGTLTGSLTSFGIVVGCYLLLAQLARPKIRLVVTAILAAAALVSLSKAAIANVILAGLIILWWQRRRAIRTLIALSVIGGAAFLVILSSSDLSGRMGVVLQSFGVQNSLSTTENLDYSVGQSLRYRVVQYPMENLLALSRLESPFVYVTGGGFGMGDTSLVPRDYSLAPTAHNGIVEIYSVFGILAGGAIVVASLAASRRIWRTCSAGTPGRLVVWTFLLLWVNNVFAGGIFYQPAAATIFYFAVFCGERVIPPKGEVATTTVETKRAVAG